MKNMNSCQNSCQGRNNMPNCGSGCKKPGCNTRPSVSNRGYGSNNCSTRPSVPGCGCASDNCGTRPSVPGCGCASDNCSTRPPVPGCGCASDNCSTKPPVPGCGCANNSCTDYNRCLGKQPLGMAYVPIQTWENISDSCTGLKNATIFEDLVLPFVNTNCPITTGRRGY